MKNPPEQLTAPQQALWWLNAGALKMGAEWEKAHAICQTAEGTFEYDLVHALAHWIEGDTTNRDYWYRRVGKSWTRAETIKDEAQAIEQRLA
jgi:hypothetical protein